MPNAVKTLHVPNVQVEPVILTGPARTQLTAATPTLTVLTLMGCATCPHLTHRITVPTVTMDSVQEAVLTWVVTVTTAPPPILIAMVAMCVSRLLTSVRQIMTAMKPSAILEYVKLVFLSKPNASIANLMVERKSASQAVSMMELPMRLLAAPLVLPSAT